MLLPLALQQLQRHEQLAPRGVPRQRGDHLRKALGETGVAREMIDRSEGRPTIRAASANSADEVSLMYPSSAAMVGIGSL